MMGAVLSAAITLVGEAHHPDAWSIGLNSRLLAPAHSGMVGFGLTYYLQGLVMKLRGPVFVTVLYDRCIFSRIHHSSRKTPSWKLIGAIVMAVGLYVVVWGNGKDLQISSSMPSGELARELPITNMDGTNLKITGDNKSTLKHAAGK